MSNEYLTKKNSFGKGVEHKVFSILLEQNFDVYVPLLDDRGIDCVVRSSSGDKYVELQIKARSKNNKGGGFGYFRKVEYYCRDNYYYVFYSEYEDSSYIWCIPSNKIGDLVRINHKTNSFAIRLLSKRKQKRIPNTKYDSYRVVNFDFRNCF